MSKLPWMWRVLGAEPVDGLGYDALRTRPEEIERLNRLFPEAVIVPLEPMPDMPVPGKRRSRAGRRCRS